MTFLGTIAGLLGAFAAARVLTNLLYEVTPGDPATYVVLALLLCAASLAASFVPAWRATRVDPLVALRTE